MNHAESTEHADRVARRIVLAQRMAERAYRGARESYELTTTSNNDMERALHLRIAARRQIDAAKQSRAVRSE
jgi:hypothetical protein